MAKRQAKPAMVMVFWGAIVLGCIVIGIWCVLDGWFGKPGGPDPTFNKLAAGVCLIALVWAIRRGVKECRKVRRLAEGQGGAGQASQQPSADTPEGDVDREN